MEPQRRPFPGARKRHPGRTAAITLVVLAVVPPVVGYLVSFALSPTVEHGCDGLGWGCTPDAQFVGAYLALLWAAFLSPPLLVGALFALITARWVPRWWACLLVGLLVAVLMAPCWQVVFGLL